MASLRSARGDAVKPVHSSRLERWLGAENVRNLSNAMRGFHGDRPIATSGIPGRVYVANDGDFYGDLRAGWEMSASDRLWDYALRLRRAMRRMSARQGVIAYSGFASLSELLSEAKYNGKAVALPFNKQSVVGQAATNTYSMWRLPASPMAATAAPASAPNGTAFTKSDIASYGSMHPDAISGDTQHLIGARITSSGTTGTLLMYDRLSA